MHKDTMEKKNKHNIRGNPVYPKVINIFYSQKLSERTATGLFMAQRIHSKSNINLVISVGANQGLIKSQATNQSPSHYKNQLLHKTVTTRPKRDLFHNPWRQTASISSPLSLCTLSAELWHCHSFILMKTKLAILMFPSDIIQFLLHMQRSLLRG